MAKRILVPLDRSPVSETVVPIVGAMARGDGSTVRLLQVAPVPRTHLTEEGRILAYADQEMARLEAEGDQIADREGGPHQRGARRGAVHL